jgi:hypothetical protein
MSTETEAKTKALADLAAAHLDFKETVRGIPDDKLTVAVLGEWSAKDIIAHVSSWEEVAALDLRRIGRGHVPFVAGFREADVDEWNAFLMRGRKLFLPAQVFHELEGCYDMLVEALETVPEAMFQQGGMVTNFLAISVHHYQDHGGHIREWRQREGI